MIIIKIAIAICLMLQPQSIAAQMDSSKYKPELSGVIILTTNGISQIPAYSLNKPAISAFFFLKLKRFSYEPDINYGIDGRPWGMGNSFMYLVLDKKKLNFKSGLALGLAFSYPEVLQGGDMVKINKSERYLIAKLIPSYLISKKTTLSLNYWYARNLEQKSINSINFLSAVLSISNVSLSQKMYCNIFTQIFYLNVDGEEGLFFSPIAEFGIKNFPLYLSSQVNTTLFTDMSSDPGFKWNVALNYKFSSSRWLFHMLVIVAQAAYLAALNAINKLVNEQWLQDILITLDIDIPRKKMLRRNDLGEGTNLMEYFEYEKLPPIKL